jgi:hypothetical protein
LQVVRIEGEIMNDITTAASDEAYNRGAERARAWTSKKRRLNISPISSSSVFFKNRAESA